MFYCRLFFKVREGTKFIANWHHELIAETLTKVYEGEIKRLIVNIPPGYTKTEMAVVMFITWAIARSPRSRFLHLSGGDDLVITNSSLTQDIVDSEHYQTLWPTSMRRDMRGKRQWATEEGGLMRAVPTKGQVIGFRAGYMDEGIYTGSLIIDDPIKAEDAFSKAMRERINTRMPNTIMSRLALDETPVVLIMQRIH
jgi:hypothetical protein